MALAEAKEELEEKLPYLNFKLLGRCYAINTEFVSSITTLPKEIVTLPRSSQYTRGVFDMRGEIIPLIETRVLFGMEAKAVEYDELVEMLEARKQDHLRWIQELERCSKTGDAFLLERNPHRCTFGKWFDTFRSESGAVNHHLQKLDEPHKRIHAAADEMEACKQDHASCKRAECLKTMFEKIKSELVPQIISLLDEAKEVFRIDFREMVIILQIAGRKIGLIVDEIVSVDNMTQVVPCDSTGNLNQSKYVTSVCKCPSVEGDIMMVDENILLAAISGEDKYKEESF